MIDLSSYPNDYKTLSSLRTVPRNIWREGGGKGLTREGGSFNHFTFPPYRRKKRVLEFKLKISPFKEVIVQSVIPNLHPFVLQMRNWEMDRLPPLFIIVVGIFRDSRTPWAIISCGSRPSFEPSHGKTFHKFSKETEQFQCILWHLLFLLYLVMVLLWQPYSQQQGGQ